MKKHLFYTLLFVFVATTIITLGGIKDWWTVKEPYLGWLVGAFLVECAAVVYTLVKGTDFFSDDGKIEDVQVAKSGPFDQDKLAQIFWLGADLHSLIFHLQSTGDMGKIHFYLKQANSHMKQSGLSGHPLQVVMQNLYHSGKAITAIGWTGPVRQQYLHQVGNLLTKIVALIEQQQGATFVGDVPHDP